MRKRTTTITVNGERWKVPRGFGAAYRREIARQMDSFRRGRPAEMIDAVIDIMMLVGYAPTRGAVADWPLRKRVEAIVYCATVALRASDNPVQRHPELPWLPDPWKGPRAVCPKHIRPDLWGAFAGATATVIAS